MLARGAAEIADGDAIEVDGATGALGFLGLACSPFAHVPELQASASEQTRENSDNRQQDPAAGSG
jgi:hypothetical protein